MHPHDVSYQLVTITIPGHRLGSFSSNRNIPYRWLPPYVNGVGLHRSPFRNGVSCWFIHISTIVFLHVVLVVQWLKDSCIRTSLIIFRKKFKSPAYGVCRIFGGNLKPPARNQPILRRAKRYVPRTNRAPRQAEPTANEIRKGPIANRPMIPPNSSGYHVGHIHLLTASIRWQYWGTSSFKILPSRRGWS
jgi:hypothetical protein